FGEWGSPQAETIENPRIVPSLGGGSQSALRSVRRGSFTKVRRGSPDPAGRRTEGLRIPAHDRPETRDQGGSDRPAPRPSPLRFTETRTATGALREGVPY